MALFVKLKGCQNYGFIIEELYLLYTSASECKAMILGYINLTINSLYSKILWIEWCFDVYLCRKQFPHWFNTVFAWLQKLSSHWLATRIFNISISHALAYCITILSSTDEANNFVIAPYCFKTKKSLVPGNTRCKWMMWTYTVVPQNTLALSSNFLWLNLTPLCKFQSFISLILSLKKVGFQTLSLKLLCGGYNHFLELHNIAKREAEQYSVPPLTLITS